MDDLRDCAAFVTGAGSGIGLAIAEAFVEAGARVTLAGRTVETLERAAHRLGPATRVQVLDVTDRAAWATGKRAAEAAFGPVDILVNNAGVGPHFVELADTTGPEVDEMIAVHLTGVCNGILAFAAAMRRRRSGHIVNNASLSGLLAGSRTGAYTAAKFGVIGLSEVLAAEMKPYGVAVSIVCAGAVETNLLRRYSAEEPPPLPADAMSPRNVARIVLDAVRRDDLYVVTHPGYRSQIADRGARIIEAFDRAAVRRVALLDERH